MYTGDAENNMHRLPDGQVVAPYPKLRALGRAKQRAACTPRNRHNSHY